MSFADGPKAIISNESTRNMLGELSPAEIEFVAEKQLVSITPKFTQNNVIYLISGNIGPFISGIPTMVPLWLAVNLRQRLKCDIILPEWLSVAGCCPDLVVACLEYICKSKHQVNQGDMACIGFVLTFVVNESLEEKKTAETESEFFTKPPHPHYMEMSRLLLQYAVDDVPKADELRTLVKDIWDMRIAKFRTSIDQFMSSDSMVARVNNLTVMEINYVRGFLNAALSVRQKLKSNQNLNLTLGDSQLLDSSRFNDSRLSSQNDISDI